jgi:hypothetical protein
MMRENAGRSGQIALEVTEATVSWGLARSRVLMRRESTLGTVGGRVRLRFESGELQLRRTSGVVGCIRD